jgi:hypothetical protein
MAYERKNRYCRDESKERLLELFSDIHYVHYRTHLGSYSESESRFIISLTKQRFIFVVAFPNILS